MPSNPCILSRSAHLLKANDCACSSHRVALKGTFVEYVWLTKGRKIALYRFMMAYESTITFTLDTICPWTYLGYVRLQKALNHYRSTYPDALVTFTLRLAPYQLYPDFSFEAQDKYVWYKKERYNGSSETMEKYARYMRNLGQAEDIVFDFEGTIANTLHAHRILHYIQTHHSPATTIKTLESLYERYFTERAHPSSPATLMNACRAAGLGEEEAKRVVENEEEGLRDTKLAIAEQTGNGVDSVPWVMIEGRKRDFTCVGAKEVSEYVKVFEQVAKEA